MNHPGLAALKHWDREKYAAGYRARFSDIPDSEMAHHCWRCGWEEARVNGIPFDPERTEPWKEGWVAVDLRLGMLAEQGHV